MQATQWNTRNEAKLGAESPVVFTTAPGDQFLEGQPEPIIRPLLARVRRPWERERALGSRFQGALAEDFWILEEAGEPVDLWSVLATAVGAVAAFVMGVALVAFGTHMRRREQEE